MILPLEEFYRRSIKKDGRMAECKECCKKRKQEDKKSNPEKIKLQGVKHCKRYRENNLEKVRLQDREYKKKYRKNNLEKVRLQDRKRNPRRYSKPQNKIRRAIATRIRYALKNGRVSGWNHCLDYTVEELKLHLESKFTKDMTWDNYGFYGWHIDHKIPVSYFNFSSIRDVEFKQCWALDNLQPMWAKENLSKHAKLIYLEGGT